MSALTFCAFLPALSNGYVWDDDAYLAENAGYHGLGWTQLRWMFTTLHAGHYMPLTWLSWAADYLIWGDRPFGYHLGNVVLHALSAVVFLLLADRLLAEAMPGASSRRRLLGAALAAVLFGVHPLRVESVAWATERKDCLSGLFYLLALLLYVRAAGAVAGRRRRVLLLAAGAVYALALLAKVMSVSLPLVMLGLDVYPLRRLGTSRVRWLTRAARRVWLEKLPFFLMAAAVAAPAPFAAAHAQTLGSLTEVGLADRLAISLFSLAFYVPKTVLPVGLSALYELPVSVNPLSLKYVASAVAVAGITAGLLVLRRHWPGALAAWWCYAVILLPVMGIVQIGPQIAADRYTYLSCLGWALLIGGGLLRVWQAGRPAWQRVAVGASGAAAVAGLWGLTWRQCGFWSDQLTLWSRAVQIDENCSICHYNLGTALIHAGRLDEAIGRFSEALRVNPKAARAEHNWAVALSELGRWDEAAEHYQAAIRIDPDYAAPHRSLGALLSRQGEHEAALLHYERARQLEPDDADTLRDLGGLLTTMGRPAEAVERLRESLSIMPHSAETRSRLAVALNRLGLYAEAIREAESAIRIDPALAEAYDSLAKALAGVGRWEQAAAAYRQTVRLRPASAAAWCNLGSVLARLGRSEEAAGHYRESLRLDPDFAQAHNNLANLLVREGEIDQALSHYESAVRIDPGFGEAYYNLGAVLAHERRYAEAIGVLEAGRREAPGHRGVARQLAWLLATCPDAALRDGQLATDLAEALAEATRFESPRVLETLAAAYAEVGRYTEATQFAARAVDLARLQGDTALADRIQAGVELYRAGRPSRLPRPAD